MIEVVLSVVMIIAGALTYAFRNTPNPYIGVRIGYTYLSKEAWRKANAFAGVYCILTGFCLLAISIILKPSKPVFLAVLLTLIAILVVYSYKIAKETYEKSSTNAVRSLRRVDVKSHLIFQLIPVIFYIALVSALWNKLPDAVAIHFDASGRPDSYADRVTGALVIPLVTMAIIPVLTVLHRESLFRSPMLLTSTQFLIGTIMTLTLLHNIGLISGKMIVLFAVIFVILLVVWMWRKSKNFKYSSSK